MEPEELQDARASAADRQWLTNVYPSYLHDLSEFDNHYYRLNDRGLWEPDHLPSWLEEDSDHPLIIRDSGRRVGFALVNEAPSPHVPPGASFRLSEFFVLRKYRRGGVGRRAAFALFGRFRGRWQLSVLARNASAIRFWRRVIREFCGGYEETAGAAEIVYRFDSGRGEAPIAGRREAMRDQRDAANSFLAEKIRSRASAICLYGLVPPKQATPPTRLQAIVAEQLARIGALRVDGLIVYDIQDEAARIPEPRPFPFLPTLDPEVYADDHLGGLEIPKIVYRRVDRDTPETFVRWLEKVNAGPTERISVLVGAPDRRADVTLPLADAYALARRYAPNLLLGGIAIAERHARGCDEHRRILAKTASGCRFFVTQAVYDVTSTKSLLSDYALAIRDAGAEPLPILLTFSPCGSEKTLAFMKWLGVAFPRWLENELRFAPDALATSLALCDRIFAEVWNYARDKGIPLGVNVGVLPASMREGRRRGTFGERGRPGACDDGLRGALRGQGVAVGPRQPG
ncbi:MAG: GNAT family N-acetyltransferase, partial [Candidatus Binatia bacterium]